jgi:hypothetical protein
MLGVKMDIDRVLTDLRAERDRLNEIIVTLERLQGSVRQDETQPKRRGRKSMDKAARQEVSERMKRYWSRRRSGSDTKTETAGSEGPSGFMVSGKTAAA